MKQKYNKNIRILCTEL